MGGGDVRGRGEGMEKGKMVEVNEGDDGGSYEKGNPLCPKRRRTCRKGRVGPRREGEGRRVRERLQVVLRDGLTEMGGGGCTGSRRPRDLKE